MSSSRAVPAFVPFMLAVACGLLVANLYYSQPLAGPIGASLGLSAAATGLIVTVTQVGYGLGLLLLVPLGDRIENRRLVVVLMLASAVTLAGAALAREAVLFLFAAFVIGLSSVAAQVLVPYAAFLAPPETRGRAVGRVMSGLVAGIVLARPVASLLAQALSWHAVYGLAALAITGLAVLFRFALPVRAPQTQVSYGALLASMAQLVAKEKVLRQRSLWHSCLFAAFSLFWTVAPLELSGPHFGLSQGGLAVFALAGAAGIAASPLGGWLADKGYTRPATGAAMMVASLSFALTRLAPEGSNAALALFFVSGVTLDFAVIGHLVLGQRAIFALGEAVRSRLNGLHIASFFLAGAVGSALGGWAFASGGWALAALIGGAFPLVALLTYVPEWRKR